MAPTCTRDKYNYSQETLIGQTKCSHCNKTFKAQGLKKHEASCKKRKEVEREQQEFNQHYEQELRKSLEFRVRSNITPPMSEKPWSPFHSLGNFEFAEIALDAALNKAQVDALLNLFTHVANGGAKITLKNESELLWEWALDLLGNPILAPHFIWDAEHLYKHNGTDFERFFDEPWTGDRWWDTQSQLPDVENPVPFSLILYADKTRLSSHGTAKGYPVVVRCANLPVEIWNGEGIGGGCVVGWLPIVPEDAEEEGKLGYTNLKRVIWHESFAQLLNDVTRYSTTGYAYTCYDKVMRWLFPIVLILSADYEEQCMMSLIRGHNGKCPCPICLNVFWLVMHSHPQDALSFDRLHHLHGGLWGKHLLNELKTILKSLGRTAEVAVENFISEFPRWCHLAHFDMVINITFSDRNKIMAAACSGIWLLTKLAGSFLCSTDLRVLKSYLRLDSLIGFDVHTEGTLAMIKVELLVFDKELKLDWDFPKVHLWKHLEHDIQNKGAAWNYSTRPNEKLHGPLKSAYQDRSNGRDFTGQILRVDHHKLAAKLLRVRVRNLEEWRESQSEDSDNDSGDTSAEVHIKLGSPCKLTLIQELEADRSQKDRAFAGIHKKLSKFLNNSLPTYGHELATWLTIAPQFQVQEYRYLKVNYESTVDWKVHTDHLCCNPAFFDSSRYDCTLIQLTNEKTAFARLIFMFTCTVPNISSFQFTLIQPYTAGIGAARRFDRDMELTRVKAVPHASSIFVPLKSIICGVVLVPDTDHDDEFFVVNHLDSDMFLRVQGLG
ncbi:hypothetical protein HYDPIDRAFT_177922 [Hydnomerulius pinastri MD-312]|uniref:Unplaced genomic scaffold scaffold_63, whole genome shotgun sequence n=1 Tax=Hydnomerulius pinastri MD-312 TaxID=994086 RepID=A0A0C9VN67_9AGAM|nr:hypothetical protein HYDPIDRAFT_177922 [Hydnomerulius pinastri MD-312]